MSIKMRKKGKPIIEADLEKIEKWLGYKLPSEYRTFIPKYNGGIPEPNIFKASSKVGEVSVNVFLELLKIVKTIYSQRQS